MGCLQHPTGLASASCVSVRCVEFCVVEGHCRTKVRIVSSEELFAVRCLPNES